MKNNLPQLKCNKFLSPLCLSVLLFLSSFLHAQSGVKKSTIHHEVTAKESGIIFINSSWNTTLKKASAENKYIFVDAYASWCGPCRQLKATTFKDKAAAAFFNKNFVNLSIDMEKGEGPSLAAQWEVQSYPTLLIFDASGKSLFGTEGFLNAENLITFGKQGLEKK